MVAEYRDRFADCASEIEWSPPSFPSSWMFSERSSPSRVPKRGYRFLVPVKEIPESEAAISSTERERREVFPPPIPEARPCALRSANGHFIDSRHVDRVAHRPAVQA
jgi:hypothetical protein